jgi:hypothetical protein
MMTMLRRYFALRRLKPVVSILPRRLASAFGPSEHYTFLQAKRAIADLHFGESLEPYAYAAVCKLQEVQKGIPSLSEETYRRLRAELVDCFDLRRPDFTLRDLLSTAYATHSPAPENFNARAWAGWMARSWAGSSGVHGAGMDAISGHDSLDASGGAPSDGGGASGGV